MRTMSVCSVTSRPRASSTALIAASEWRDRADAADAADDGLDIVVAAAAHHGLEEARRFGHLPLASFDLAVVDVDDDIAVAFDAGDVMNVDVNVLTHSMSAPVCLPNSTIFGLQVVHGQAVLVHHFLGGVDVGVVDLAAAAEAPEPAGRAGGVAAGAVIGPRQISLYS